MATILVVDDEQPVQDFLEVVLTPEHEVVQVTNATQAIEVARLFRPDLILLDINLKDQHDGVEVCRILRNDPDPIVAHVPIIMLTGHTRQIDIAAALAVGANSYVGKPFNPTALLALVSTLLTRRNT